MSSIARTDVLKLIAQREAYMWQTCCAAIRVSRLSPIRRCISQCILNVRHARSFKLQERCYLNEAPPAEQRPTTSRNTTEKHILCEDHQVVSLRLGHPKDVASQPRRFTPKYGHQALKFIDEWIARDHDFERSLHNPECVLIIRMHMHDADKKKIHLKYSY